MSKLQTIFSNYQFEGGFLHCTPCGQSIISRGGLYSKVSDNEKQVPLEIGSVTKFFTAICIYRLILDKKINS